MLVGLLFAGTVWLVPTVRPLEGLWGDELVWRLRVPRAGLALLCGAGLSVGGATFQMLFRNPLATPYTLGIASAASLGAAFGFLLGLSGSMLGIPLRVWLALVGAGGGMLLVVAFARQRAGADMTRLLLAGVCVAYLSSAGILLITYVADRAVTNDIVLWMMGSLAVLRSQATLEIVGVLVPTLAVALYFHRAYDLLQFDTVLAQTRGVAVGRTIWFSFALVSLLVAIIVSNCGPIGFVGLMVPHMVRALVGPRAAPLLLGSAIVGAGFLLLCDGLAQLAPDWLHGRDVGYEFPVGVITNMLGAVFFLFLLARARPRGC